MSGNNYYETKINERVKAALAEKEKEFESAHGRDTDRELLEYLMKVAVQLGHTPRRYEFVGWKTIDRRFDGLNNACKLLHLPVNSFCDPVSECDLIQQVTREQRALYKKERQEKKAKKEQWKLQCEQRRKEEDAWLLEHDPDRYYKKIRKRQKKQDKKDPQEQEQ